MARQIQALLGLYLLVGILATALHYAVLLGLVEVAGLPPGTSAGFGALCGALAAYAGNHRFTFRGRAPHRDALPRFLTIAALGAAANGGVVWTGTELGAHYLAVQALATAAVIGAGFVMNQRWTFA